MKRLISLIISLFVVLNVGSCAAQYHSVMQDEQPKITGNLSNDKTRDPDATGNLKVHFINVGQGDSAFIEMPNGETMLIDAGEREYGEVVVNYITTLGYNKVDYLIGTHPHSDHIGGMAYVVNSLNIGKVYMPRVQSDTVTFEKLLLSIKNKGLSITTAKAGVNILSGAVSADILSPVKEEYDDFNNYSAVVKIVYGETSFLFMGDAETVIENDIDADVSADVIKVGHHGSSTSSSRSFISRVGAQIAVVSVGEENSYGHPHDKTLEAWRLAGATIMRTDLLGTIVVTSNGSNISTADGVVTLVPATDQSTSDSQFAWVLNLKSKKVHYPDCNSVDDINENNKKYSNKSLNELKAEGYSPCGNCKPS